MTTMTRGGKRREREGRFAGAEEDKEEEGGSSRRRRRRLYYEGRRETFIILFRWSEAGNLVL